MDNALKLLPMTMSVCLLLASPSTWAEQVSYAAVKNTRLTAMEGPPVICGSWTIGDQGNKQVTVLLNTETMIVTELSDYNFKQVGYLPNGIYFGSLSRNFTDGFTHKDRGLVNMTRPPQIFIRHEYTDLACYFSFEYRYTFTTPPVLQVEAQDVSVIDRITTWIKGYVDTSPDNVFSSEETRSACMCTRG